MIRQFKVIAFIIFAIVAMFGTTGCLKTSAKIVNGNATGKVFDSNGKALHKAQVAVYGTSLVTETDEYGKYTLNGIAVGQAKLVATYNDKSVIKVISIKRGETLENADITFVAEDLIPPVMLNVTVASLTEETAQITWTTNEMATSIVDYATGPVGLNGYTMLASDTGLTTEHSITLEKLLSGKVYHFRVRGIDMDKNEGVSSDYQFTTLKGAAPAIPENVNVTVPAEQEKLVVSWNANTEDDILGYNIFRSTSPNGEFEKIISVSSDTTSYTDGDLSIATKYYYKVQAYDTAGNDGEISNAVSAVTPGTLTENRVWTKENSPYIIQGDIRLRANYTLTIEPGVEIKFTQYDKIPDTQGATMTALIIQGSLNAVGTEESPIIFTSAESSPRIGCWDGIYFIGTTSTSNLMKYCSIVFAEKGVKSENSIPVIENCTFSSCNEGMEIYLSTTLNIKYNIIQDCHIGIVSSGSNIMNNLFSHNEIGAVLLGADSFQYNTLDDLIGVQVQSGSPTIKNNIIARVASTAGGIYGIEQTNTSAAPVLSYNNIYNYTVNFQNVTTGTETAMIFTDPMFEGGFPYSYELQTGSPALTADENGGQLGYYHTESD